MLKPVPHGLLQAFRAYQSALAGEDEDALDALFADSPTTLRGDAAGLLVGHDGIGVADLGEASARRVVQTHVQVIDADHALIVAVTEPAAGGRGQQTQLWARDPSQVEYGGWRVTAEHLSGPAPALDTRIWRLVGDPLVPASDPDGPLSGESVAVKDLYAVAGHAIGAGNPEWLRHADPSPAHAAVVAALLDAGASVRGITRTEEFAYGLAGDNAHYGAAPNPAAPRRLPGGSSSGSASAVSLGHATVGLGTDTGGSVRVPAAYQGLFAIRTTHGAVSREGVLALAPSFDAVGWLTRSANLLRAVGDVLLPREEPGATPSPSRRVVAATGLLQAASPDVAAAVRDWLPPETTLEPWPAGDPDTDLDAWRTAYQTVQGYEAWATYGAWLEPRLDTVGAEVRGRFEVARRVTEAQAEAARAVLAQARASIREYVGDRIVVLPSAPTVAPLPRTSTQAPYPREATLRLTCLAAIGGLPAVSLPVRTGDGLPAGVGLLAAAGRDRALLDLVVELADA